MDIKDIVIAVLVISLVFVIGLVLGQRKNRSHSQQDSDQARPGVTIKAGQSELVSASPMAKPLKDYSREFEFFEIFQNKAKNILPKIFESHCQEAFDNQFQIINKAYEEFCPERNEHSSEEIHKLFSTILSGVSFGNVISQTQKKSDLIAIEILSGYQSEIDDIFLGQKFEHLSNKYRLGSDLKAEQLKKISSIILGKFNTVIMKSKEFDQKREWLFLNYENFVKLTDADTDWGAFAKHFAGGALAVANPIIGIPMLIFNWTSGSEKDKQQKAFVDRYAQEWDEFESMVEPLRQEIMDATAKVSEYLHDKYEELFNGVVVILKETAATGHSIEHYFVNIKETDMPSILKLEKELGI